jgi:integrase
MRNDSREGTMLFEKGLIGRKAHLRPIVRFDLDTGFRLGEATRLEPDHINLNEKESKWFEIEGEAFEVPPGCFIVIKSKNGKLRVIPMNSRASAVAVQQINDTTVSKYLFPSYKTEEMIKGSKKGASNRLQGCGHHVRALRTGWNHLPHASTLVQYEARRTWGQQSRSP